MRILLIAALMWTSTALAHETSDEKLRVILVSEDSGSTTLHIRLPAPLVLAPQSTARDQAEPSPPQPSFIRWTDPQQAPVFDQETLAQAPEAFAHRVVSTLSISLDQKEQTPTVRAVAVHHAAQLPYWRTPQEAVAALANPRAGDDVFVADAYIDAALTLDGVGDLTISFPVDAAVLPSHVHLANIIADARAQPLDVRMRLGALTTPVILKRP